MTAIQRLPVTAPAGAPAPLGIADFTSFERKDIKHREDIKHQKAQIKKLEQALTRVFAEVG